MRGAVHWTGDRDGQAIVAYLTGWKVPGAVEAYAVIVRPAYQPSIHRWDFLLMAVLEASGYWRGEARRVTIPRRNAWPEPPQWREWTDAVHSTPMEALRQAERLVSEYVTGLPAAHEGYVPIELDLVV